MKIIDRLKNFASILSHDIREPVRTIKSFSQILSRRIEKDLDIKNLELFQLMTNGAERLNNMTEILYNYSNNTLVLLDDFSEINLNHIIDNVRKDLTARIKYKQASIIVNELPAIEGQGVFIYQLFQNLISNSLKYSKEDVLPVIEIQSIEKEEEVLISVKDNGIGIDKAKNPELFRLFKRAKGIEGYSGFGIGLATCSEIMELHGGKIWFESELGEGTMMFLKFIK